MKTEFRKFIKNSLAILYILSLPGFVSATNVLFETPLGSFEVELFDNETPVTVENFLKYINDGDYENSFVHRSVTDFVIQGGGFVFVDEQFSSVPTDPAIENEFNRSNTRGTISMAKLGGDPDSATSQWFINVSDNSENLDNQNGGFTVFGRVIGDGMAVVDAINDLEQWNAENIHPALTSLPLIDYDNSVAIARENLVFTSITISSGDEDDDGVADENDNCPNIANPDQANADTDEQGNACDDDDDNDNLSDTEESELGTDALYADTDNDGVDDGDEIARGSNPLVNEKVLLQLLLTEED